jgi:hypothetical protein
VRGAEVDIVVEGTATLLLVEAKSGATVADDFFGSAHALSDRLTRARERRTRRVYVVFGGDTPQRRSDATVLPWSRIQEPEWAKA